MSEELTPEAAECERRLTASWAVGSLRPWLGMLAQRELPASLRGRVETSDIVQQTLLDAWRGTAGFRGTTLPERLAWLKVIMRRVILQHRRTQYACQKRAGNRERLQSELSQTDSRIQEWAKGSAHAPDELAAANETALHLAAAIERLSLEEQELIRWRQFDRMTHEQIAAKLDRTPASVRMMWVRALRKLREYLPNET